MSSIPFKSQKPLAPSSIRSPRTRNPTPTRSLHGPQPPHRSRNCSFGVTINEVRRVAEKPAGSPVHLPENYEILAEFFDSLDNSMRLAQLKASTPTFGNLCPKSDSELQSIVKIGEGTFGEAFKASNYVCKIVPIDGDIRVNGEMQKDIGTILQRARLS